MRIKYVECPYCHSKQGYYRKVRIRQYYNFYGEMDGSEALYYDDKTEAAWCANCNHKLYIPTYYDDDDRSDEQ